MLTIIACILIAFTWFALGCQISRQFPDCFPVRLGLAFTGAIERGVVWVIARFRK